MKKNRAQLLNSLLIMLGAVLTIVGIASEEEHVFLKVGGIVMLMFGLYKATGFFITSEEERKNSEKEEDEEF